MNNITRSFQPRDIDGFKIKMLNWCSRFNIFCFLDSQQYQGSLYSWVLGAGAREIIECADTGDLQKLSSLAGFKFGHLCYELNHANFGLERTKKGTNSFPQAAFFIPQVLIRLEGEAVIIEARDPHSIYTEIQNTVEERAIGPAVVMQPRLSKEEYISQVEVIRDHIRRGDCYELNYCQEFLSNSSIQPASTFIKLSSLSPNPFTAFYRYKNNYLICASPERFLRRQGNRIISQPIKGTAPRFKEEEKDRNSAKELRLSMKERAENVMVVDLVRNDLSKVCKEGSVVVSELFGLYSFPQVHQLISTVEGELKAEESFSSVMEACFPMGSMTGAPKKRVMEIIDKTEPGARGIFSGSVGYMDEKGNFDFNVVIRSLMYNSETAQLSYQVGSGITFYSNALKEWEECMVKAEAIKKVLEGPALL